jgi:hypothetical protein
LQALKLKNQTKFNLTLIRTERRYHLQHRQRFKPSTAQLAPTKQQEELMIHALVAPQMQRMETNPQIPRSRHILQK